MVSGSRSGQWRPHFVQRLDEEAGAVLEAAAVFVVTLVGDGREEAGAEEAVCVVQLAPFEPGLGRAPRAVREVALQARMSSIVA